MYYAQLEVALTVFDFKGIPETERERIAAAVEAGGKHLTASYEAWISEDPFGEGVRVLITGPSDFESKVKFPVAEDPQVIAERVRAALRDLSASAL